GRRRYAALAVVPLHVDAALRIGLEDLGTVLGVHGHAAATRDEPRDPLARQRLTALAEADQHVLHARHPHAALRLPADQPHEALERALFLLSPPLQLLLGEDLRQYLLAGELAVADVGEERLLVAKAELLQHALERAVLAQLAEVELMAGEVALEDLLPDRHRALALLP